MSKESSFDRVAQTYLSQIEKFLTSFLDGQSVARQNFCSDMSLYHFSTGGKRIRALIPLVIFEALGSRPEAAVPLGAGIEMIHNATLVHDDLQDGDQVRRGKPTVWKKYSEAQAINCGDAMFFYALQLIDKLDVPDDRKARIHSLAINATLDVIEGQAQEFLMKSETFPSIKRYLEIIGGKTSGLFSLPIVAALEALGSEKSMIDVSSRSAHALGVVFQIQDDLLDIYGHKNRDQRATDVAEGKISFLVAHVNESGSKEDRQILADILKTPREQTSQAQIEMAISVFEKYGAHEAALRHIDGVRKNLSDSEELSRYPKIKNILLDLGDLFLRPLEF